MTYSFGKDEWISIGKIFLSFITKRLSFYNSLEVNQDKNKEVIIFINENVKLSE